MAAHRYWRAVNLQPYDGGLLVALSEFWLLAAGVRVDGTATLSSSIAPVNGSLANLADNDLDTDAVLDKRTALQWDFGGSPQDVTDIRLGAASSQAMFLLSVVLQYSDDGATWFAARAVVGVAWPDARTLTSSKPGVPNGFGTIVDINFDGADGATRATDEYGHGVSFNGNAKLTTTNPKYGSAALLLNGVGSGSPSSTQDAAVITTDDTFGFGSGDFTIEAWALRSITPVGFAMLFDFRPALENGAYPTIYLDSSNRLVYYTNDATPIVQSSGSMPADTWQHVALSRVAGVSRLFLHGNQVGGDFADTSVYLRPPRVSIGASSYNTAGGGWGGRVDSVRFSRIGLYAANFSPPPGPFGAGILLNEVRGQVSAVGPAFLPTGGATPSNVTGLGMPLTKTERNYNFSFGRGRIASTVKRKAEPANIPLRRRVRLYRDRDGLLIQETWSDAVTGAYEFRGFEEWEAYSVVAHDYTLNLRAVIADHLTLENGGVTLLPLP